MGAGVQHLAAIYSNKEVISPGENLTKAGVRVEIFSPAEKLDPLSRINYAKVYTVEYNVKVFFIGRVHRDHQHRFLADYKNFMGLDYLALREVICSVSAYVKPALHVIQPKTGSFQEFISRQHRKHGGIQ
jgi:hypothetical protein